jgi:hypothetical protein
VALQVTPQGMANPRARTFSQVYSDKTKVPCARNYARIMQCFDASILSLIAELALFNQVTNVSASQL